MIKEYDQQAKTKATPRMLAYADSDEEAPARTPSKNKEPSHLRRSRRLEDRSRTKEKTRRERPKSRGKRSGHQETSSDSEYEEGSEDTYEDLNLPCKRPKPTPFTQRITRFKYHRRAKVPRNIRVYEGNKDPKDHLDSFEELSQKFLEEFSQQKRYAKDPTEIHGIKRRQNEAFMHGHGHPELAKKLNDKIPKTVDEMFERVRAFIRGEVAACSAEMKKLWPQEVGRSSKGYPLEQPEERESRKEQRKSHKHDKGRGNRKRPFEGERSGLTDELTFPAIPRNQLTDEPIIFEGRIEDHQVQRILVDGGSSSEIMYEHCFRNLSINIRSRLRRCRAMIIGFSGETYNPLGIIDLQVTMGEAGRNKTVLMEFAIVKCHSPYNVIIGRTRMRSLIAVGSTIHSMIKFPTNQGIVTMETSREALWECRQLEMVQGSWKEVQWRQHKEQMSSIREQAILRTKSSSDHGPNQGPVPLEKTWDKENTKEILTSSQERLNQYVTIGTTLTADCKRLLTDVLRENIKVANTIPVKLANGTWKVQVDYSSLNKVCAKDMYPFPEEGEELASLMEYPYKCFLRLLKENNQIRMAKNDE
ncbi:reverse transcriptase domain-containing protein [Tanacetum coccineum]